MQPRVGVHLRRHPRHPHAGPRTGHHRIRGLRLLALALVACGAKAAPVTPPRSELAARVEAAWFAGDRAFLVAQLAGPERRLAIRALGQVGEQTDVALLARLLPADSDVVTRALGVMGRRKLSLAEVPREALRAADPWGVAYLLANGGSPEDLPLAHELLELPGVRWMALRAIGATTQAASSGPRYVVARYVSDRSLAARVEAVRLLGGSSSSSVKRLMLASWLRTQRRDPAALHFPRAPVILEAARLLGPHVNEDALLKDVMLELTTIAPGATAEARRVTDELICLGHAAEVRAGGPYARLLACGGPPDGWPELHRRQLVFDLIADGRGSDAERTGAMMVMWRSENPAIRGLGAAAAVKLNRFDIVAEALKGNDPLVSGPAIDELSAKTFKRPMPPELTEIVRARALAETDPEILIGLIGMLDLTDPANQAIRDAAAKSPVTALRQAVESKELVAPVAPPLGKFDFAAKRWRLRIETTRGRFHIDLDDRAAPLAVSALLTLAQRGFYDGLIFHRVVPNFVVQGGDPTGSGWGGPGFLLPAEPSSGRYTRGAVGMADAGKDTAGSQWFVTLQESPHLEGRYTIVGRVPEGEMSVVDQLLVGDRMTTVVVESVRR